MTLIPSQTLPHWVPSDEEDMAKAELAAREARWWRLGPGEPGYGQTLHEYLGFTEQQWREYAISERRVRR